jgi:hypothetical protein
MYMPSSSSRSFHQNLGLKRLMRVENTGPAAPTGPCGTSLEGRRLESAASSSGESGGKLGKSEGLQ